MVRMQDAHQVGEHGSQPKLFQRRAKMLVHEGLKLCGQGFFIDYAVARPVQQYVGDERRLLLHQAEQQMDQLVPPLVAEPAHHAEINKGTRLSGR